MEQIKRHQKLKTCYKLDIKHKPFSIIKSKKITRFCHRKVRLSGFKRLLNSITRINRACDVYERPKFLDLRDIWGAVMGIKKLKRKKRLMPQNKHHAKNKKKRNENFCKTCRHIFYERKKK